jgi:hypothetical protein
MRYNFTHIIETDAATFWNRVYFDPEFNRELYLTHLRFSTYIVSEDRLGDDGTRHRRVECVPKIDLPGPIRSMFGDGTGYVEVGRFDPKTQHYHIGVIPKLGGEKIKTTSEIWVQAEGSNRIVRHATGEAQVKVFGLGGTIEGMIEKQAREMHEKSAEFTNRWIRSKGL